MKSNPFPTLVRTLSFRHAFRAFLGIALALVLLGFTPQGASAGDCLSIAQPVTVMQQNLYLGAEIFQIVGVAPKEIPGTVFAIYLDVVSTRFPDRAKALADEIEDTMPDLIGLQEVSLFRIESPGDFLTNFTPDAEVVVYDFLDLILKALAKRGLHYRVASVVENADVELPMYNPKPGSQLDDARLTDRDVILVRSDISTWGEVSGNYQSNLTFDLGLGDVEFKRGYTSVKARVRGTTYRFVSTHLEVEGGEIDSKVRYFQAFQAAELIRVFKKETSPVILVGDINSSPEDTTPLPLDQAPYFIMPPYVQLTLAGYADIWPRRILGRSNPGFTCCQDADLLNKRSVLDERIDFIFVRNSLGHAPWSFTGPVFAWTIGDTPGDKTRTLPRLWPSDHAGVMGHLRIPLLR